MTPTPPGLERSNGTHPCYVLRSVSGFFVFFIVGINMNLYEEQLQLVKKLMNDTSPRIRCKAIQKFAQLDKVVAEDILIRELDNSIIDIDIACYVKALTSISSFSVSEKIIKNRLHESPLVRIEVLKYIKINYTNSYEEILIDCLSDSDIHVRLEALDIIGELKLYSALSDILVTTIVSVSSKFIKHAKKVLFSFLTSNSSDIVLQKIKSYRSSLSKNRYKYLTHDEDSSTLEFSQQIRDSIIYTLKEFPDIDCIDKLKYIFENCKDSKRVINSLYALNQLEVNISTAKLVDKIFTVNSDYLKIEIIKSIKDSKNKSWLEIVFNNFNSLNDEAKIEAIKSSKGNINDKVLNTLIDELLNCDIKNEIYLNIILGALANYNSHKILKPVISKIKEIGKLSTIFSLNLKFFIHKDVNRIIYPFLNSKNLDNVKNAINGLAKANNIDAIKHLVNCYQDKDKNIKLLIINGLGVIDSDDAIEHLLKFAIIEDDKEVLSAIENSIKTISMSNPESYPVKMYINSKENNVSLKNIALIVLENLGVSDLYDGLLRVIDKNENIKSVKNAISLLSKSNKKKYGMYLLTIIENKEYSEEIREYVFDIVYSKI